MARRRDDRTKKARADDALHLFGKDVEHELIVVSQRLQLRFGRISVNRAVAIVYRQRDDPFVPTLVPLLDLLEDGRCEHSRGAQRMLYDRTASASRSSRFGVGGSGERTEYSIRKPQVRSRFNRRLLV